MLISKYFQIFNLSKCFKQFILIPFFFIFGIFHFNYFYTHTYMYIYVYIYIHSGALKIAPQEGKKIQSRNFADKKKNMWYANDPSLMTMRMAVHPAVALQSVRERDINQR